MGSQWLKNAAKSAAASSGSWIALNPLTAVLIAALILVTALGGWGRAIERGRMADGILKAAADNTARLIEAQKEISSYQAEVEQLRGQLLEADRKVAESRRKLEEARRVARAEFRPPASTAETLARYRKLGYRGRLK